MNLFLPDYQVNSIYEVTPAFLKAANKKGVIVDLDNTLVPWNVAHATDEVIEWLKNMKESGIHVTIFSNNSADRVTLFAEPLGTQFIYVAKKPLRRAFLRAQKVMNIKKDEIVVIGDQLLTDVFGGNRVGFGTILVNPIIKSDAPVTKFNRHLERLIINYFYRKGKLTRRPNDEK